MVTIAGTSVRRGTGSSGARNCRRSLINLFVARLAEQCDGTYIMYCELDVLVFIRPSSADNQPCFASLIRERVGSEHRR